VTTPHPIVATLDARTRDLDITQTALAHAIGTYPHALYKWRTGQASPPLACVALWADHVGLILAVVTPTRQVVAAGVSILRDLVSLRQLTGISQRDLAARRRVSQNTVSALERGIRNRPHLRTVDDHLTALGLRLVLLRPQVQEVAA
jgi:DNA-binding XRE family transcriptional regulator